MMMASINCARLRYKMVVGGPSEPHGVSLSFLVFGPLQATKCSHCLSVEYHRGGGPLSARAAAGTTNKPMRPLSRSRLRIGSLNPTDFRPAKAIKQPLTSIKIGRYGSSARTNSKSWEPQIRPSSSRCHSGPGITNMSQRPHKTHQEGHSITRKRDFVQSRQE